MSFFVRRGDVLEGPVEPAALRGRLGPGALVAAEAEGPFAPPAELFRPGSRAAARLAEGLELPTPALVGPGRVFVAAVLALDLVTAVAIGAGLSRSGWGAASIVLALITSAALLVAGHRHSLAFSILCSSVVAVQSVAAGGRPGVLWAAAHATAALIALGLALSIRRRARALLSAIGVEPRTGPALTFERAGPPMTVVLAAYASAYALYAALVFLYHRAAYPLNRVEPSLVVYGSGALALVVRASLYVLLLAASLWVLRASGSKAIVPLALPRGRALGPAALTALLLYLAVYLSLAAADALTTLLARAGHEAAGSLQQALGAEARRSAAPATAVLVLYAVVLGPLAEEVVFRGVLLQTLRARLPVVLAIVLQALAFALLHPYRAALYQVAIVGLLAGWAAHRTGSLWPGIVAHAAWNGMLTLQASGDR